MLYKLAFGDTIPEEKYAKVRIGIESIFENIKNTTKGTSCFIKSKSAFEKSNHHYPYLLCFLLCLFLAFPLLEYPRPRLYHFGFLVDEFPLVNFNHIFDE